jgi:hypothetical protein
MGWVALAGLVAGRLLAQEPIPDAEALQPPTAARIASLVAAAQRDGWPAQVAPLRAAARLAYEKEKSLAAEGWFYVYRWADLLGQPEPEFLPRWINAIDAFKVGHPNMASRYTPAPRPLGAALSPEAQAWSTGNSAFLQEFFGLVSPVDYLPAVFAILTDLFRLDPARFKANANLALAIAVVYDVPPPPIWPHGQVTAAALARKFPTPAESFTWWTRQDQQGKTYHKLARLGADELKFVVDVAAPFAELEWAQANINQPLASLAATYSMIRYRNDRVQTNTPVWPGRTYRLAEILAEGGICADQAYFATQVGKARGVPTLLFNGAGSDGRHAWFGYLDASQKWQLDAGRYAEQRFVTGLARDPQTWREFSDHELQFLTERFRELPSFRQSRLHAAFAADYLASKEGAPAVAAGRKAVNYERRNLNAWEMLVAATRLEARDPKAVENVLREAAIAFQRYPDLEALYVNRVSESLRARGETSAADAEVRRIAQKNQASRNDLSVQQARDVLRRAMTTQDLAGQIRSYNSVLDTFGRGAGMGFFDQVVTVFVEHLAQSGQPSEATNAIERARRTLKVDPNSQLEREFAELGARVRAVSASKARK